MIKAHLENASRCDCCGHTHMKRVIVLNSNGTTLQLGVVCCGRWFNVNMSGNVWKAVARLRNKIDTLSRTQSRHIIELILEAKEEIADG